MATIKDYFFAFRDWLRFVWARNRFTFIPYGKVEEFSLKQMRHIVVIKVDGKLGDTQIMTHFYRSLQEQIPDLVLSVVCPVSLAHIYSEVLGFDQVVISSDKPRRAEIESICQKLCGDGALCSHVDLVVTTVPFFKPRDFIFNYYLQPRYIAGCVVALKDQEINLFLFDVDKDQRFLIECFTDFLQWGQLDFPPIHYEPLYRPEVLQEVKAHLLDMAAQAKNTTQARDQSNSPELLLNRGQLAQEEPSPLIIGINPCGASVQRCLTVEMISTFVEQLYAKCQDGRWGKELSASQQVVLILMTPPSMQNFADKVNLKVKERESSYCILRTLPRVDTEYFAAYVGALSGVITVDTAVVHLACASDVPQLCFYRIDPDQKSTQRWHPYSDKAIVINACTYSLDSIDSDLFVSKSLDFVMQLIEQHSVSAAMLQAQQ